MLQGLVAIALLAIVILVWLIDRRNRQKQRGRFLLRDLERETPRRWWQDRDEDDLEGDH